MNYAVWFILLIIILLLIRHIQRNKDFYKLSWNLPGPIPLPFIGNALTFLHADEELFNVMVNKIKDYPSPMRFWFGTKLVFVVSDVHHAEIVMSSAKFATKDDLYKYLQVFTGEGLISGSGAKWKRDRKLIGPWFLKRNTEFQFPIVLRHAKKLVQILQNELNHDMFNVAPYLHNCVLDIVNEIILGVSTNCQDGEFQGLAATAKKAIKHAYNHKESPDVQNSAIQFLLNLRHECGAFSDETDLMYQLVTLFSASEDTIMIICSFALVLFGMHPDLQEKAIDEIQNFIPNKDFSLNDLDQLSFLEMCIKETLRLFPIAPFILRKTTEKCQIGSFQIPKNCSIIISIYNLHTNPLYWEKPDEFYPEHFLPEKIQSRPQYVYMPFSAGIRGCTGKATAIMAIKTILILLLKTYKFESNESLKDKRLRADISVRFRDDNYPVKIKYRY